MMSKPTYEELERQLAEANARAEQAEQRIAVVKERDQLRQQINELQEFFSDALQADFENGAKWLNENESAEFKRKYPNIWDGINKIGTMLEEAVKAEALRERDSMEVHDDQ